MERGTAARNNPANPGRNIRDNPGRVDGKRKEKNLLRGPEKDLDLAEAPVSPDNRYVALHQWRGKGNERTKLLHMRRAGIRSYVAILW